MRVLLENVCPINYYLCVMKIFVVLYDARLFILLFLMNKGAKV